MRPALVRFLGQLTGAIALGGLLAGCGADNAIATQTRAAEVIELTVAARTNATPQAVPPTATPMSSTPTPALAATPSTAPTSAPTAPPSPVPVSPTTAPTVTRAPTPTLVPPSPTSGVAARAPSGTPPSGWKTYSGSPRAPFSLYYPPDWIVDDSRLAGSGIVRFDGPDPLTRFEIAVGATLTDVSIDAWRDRLAQEVGRNCARAGVERTAYESRSNVTFATMVETCDTRDIQGGAQVTYYLWAGLRGQHLWALQMTGESRVFNRNTCKCAAGVYEQYDAPMLASLNIYGDPA